MREGEREREEIRGKRGREGREKRERGTDGGEKQEEGADLKLKSFENKKGMI